MIIMPNDSGEFGFTFDAITDAAVEKMIDDAVAKGNADFVAGPIGLTVAVVAFYKSTVSDVVRQTAHVMWLRKADKTQFDPALGDVPPENIKVGVLASDSIIT